MGTDWKFPEERLDYHPMPANELVLPPHVFAALRPPGLPGRVAAAKRQALWQKLGTQPNFEAFFAAATAPLNQPIYKILADFRGRVSHEAAMLQALGDDPRNAEQVATCVSRIADLRQQLQTLGATTLVTQSASQVKIDKLLALKSVGLNLSGHVALDESALHLATRSGLDGLELGKIVTLLIAWRVPVDSKDGAGDTVCHRLAHARHGDPLPSLRAVITAGADLAAPNKDGRTALELILQRPQDGCALFESLQTFKASVTSISPVHQQNLLHTVILHHDDPHVVDFLLRAQVNPVHEDWLGLTPWDHARILGRTASLQVIEAYVASLLNAPPEVTP